MAVGEVLLHRLSTGGAQACPRGVHNVVRRLSTGLIHSVEKHICVIPAEEKM